jgi:hypothetical protein
MERERADKGPRADRRRWPTAGEGVSQPVAQPGEGLLALQDTVGNRGVQRLLQAKLRVSQSGDPYEQEADRVADAVVQRKCTCPGPGPCPACEEDKAVLRRKPVEPTPTAAGGGEREAPAVVRETVGAGGRPLDETVRADMEGRFGHDFSRVRVHTGAQAERSAALVNALAYTVGSHVVFGEGQYAPTTEAGRRLLAHELTHTVQQGTSPAAPCYFLSCPSDRADVEARNAGDAVIQNAPVPALRLGITQASAALIQRDDPPTPAPAPSQPAPEAGAPDVSQPGRAEQEQQAFEAARARAGQPAATILFSNPVSPSQMASPETEVFTTQQVVARPEGEPKRTGFDSPGPATVYAASSGGDVGGAVFEQDGFFFAARLNPGSHKLTVTIDAHWYSVFEGNFEWWKSRDYVYRVTPAAGVRAVTGRGGFVFPLNRDLEVDPDRARFIKDPAIAAAPDAESMRKVAGVLPEAPGDKPKLADETAIAPEQQDAFIASYFRARGLEALQQNEAMVDKLAETFKPTQGGTESSPAKGVSAGAKALIDASRMMGVYYREILEGEAILDAQIQYALQNKARINLGRATADVQPGGTIVINGRAQTPDAWIKELQEKQAEVGAKKTMILSASPLLAQLVAPQDPAARLDYPKGDKVAMPGILPNNPYDRSLLAKQGNDEEVRAAFEKKLDAVRQALRRARSEMTGGDLDFLMGLEGLRNRVKADLSRVKGKNAGLSMRLDAMLADHQVRQLVWTILETSIQVGLLFVPGGQVLSAVLGFVSVGGQMDEHLREWDVSKAAVDPASALADQQQAESALALDTIMLVASAVDLGHNTNRALGALEQGTAAGGKALAEKLGEVIGEAATPLGGIKVTKAGLIFSCRSPCEILRAKYGEIFRRDSALGQRLSWLESQAAKAAADPTGGKALAEQVAREAEALEERLFQKYPELDPEVVEQQAARRKAAAESPSNRSPESPGTVPHTETADEWLKRMGLTEVPHYPPETHVHHLLPREFEPKFAAAGLNIEEGQFKVVLSPEEHLGKVHMGMGGGLWNMTWDAFFQNHPVITPKLQPDILQQLARMRASFGI